MDISFKTPEGRFNLRACAVIIEKGRLLAMRDGHSPYFYLPGGRVRMNEAADAALRRELREELGVEGRIVRPLWLNQGFFTEDVTGERFHELCLYYLADVSGTGLPAEGAFSRTDGGNGRVNAFEWLPFERVKSEYLYPLFIKEALDSLPETFTILATHE
ncbi:MAG: NUDIX domain-containing protein [Clostridia bacterium]|nr:NUDIX domain-containing protein [Clostridia bacterium]